MCNKDFVYGSEIERLGVRGRPLARCGDTLGRKEKCNGRGMLKGVLEQEELETLLS